MGIRGRPAMSPGWQGFTPMLDRLLRTETFLTAQGALDGASARHSALSVNVANVNTPGYRRKDVPFEAELEGFVRGQVSPCTGAACGPLRYFRPPILEDSSGAMREDGNNVDIEVEMVRLAENTMRYQAIAQYVGGFFGGLKYVINNSR
jgi:flagellar basal-body rod protein FlgB